MEKRTRQQRAKVRQMALDMIEKRKRGTLKYKLVSEEEWLAADNIDNEEDREAACAIRRAVVDNLKQDQQG